jgi:hypothetical protein
MLTAPSPSFFDWKNALTSIGLKDSHVTDDLIGILTAYGFDPSKLFDESFKNYWEGNTEEEAGAQVAKEFASLNILQEFLEPAIDWVAAWYMLKTTERYILVKTNQSKTWALFMPE